MAKINKVLKKLSLLALIGGIYSLTLFVFSFSSCNAASYPQSTATPLATDLSMNQYKLNDVGDMVTKGPWMDVRAFGAVGDGEADDTLAIQGAINALPSAGGILFIPTGIYKITSELYIVEKRAIIIRGEGANETIQYPPMITAEGSILKWAGMGGGVALLKLVGVENLEISDLSLDGEGIAYSLAIQVLNGAIDTSSILFRRMAICYFTTGIQLSSYNASNVDTSVIDDVTFRSNTTGISFNASQAVGWTIRNCHFLNNATGIHLVNQDPLDSGGGFFLENSSFSDSGTSINLASVSDGIEIRNCTFECGPNVKAISCAATAGQLRMLVRVMNCRIDGTSPDLVTWTGQASLYMDGNRIKDGVVRLNNAISNSSVEPVHTFIGNWFAGTTADLVLDTPTASDRAYLVFDYNNQRTQDEAAGTSPVLRLRRAAYGAGVTTEWEQSRNGLKTKSISGTGINANNLRGQATLNAGTGSLVVTFPTAEPDNSYYIQLTGNANRTLWVTNKTATGFTINRSSTTGTMIVDWILIR
ncbi:MAG: right-handed parallel beta-helix repeat-containing protein [Planctomycetes bacterium]|nr:right-handed parallel beta-helix repeat-containing protein [Planctomycetota bacterium]